MIARLEVFVLVLLCSSIVAHEDDGCPQNFRRCNDLCLDNTTNHTTPCAEGPWGKCLSARFPFYCPLTNTCIRKDELCGDLCFNGSPDSFWYDHWTIVKKRYEADEWIEKDNKWRLKEGSYATMEKRVPVWLERYNCNGKCTTYLESCNGGCDHPDGIGKGGVTISMKIFANLVKCGKECRKTDNMRGFHDCGEECLPQNMPCKGTCTNSTNWATGPQWKCGNECRPTGDNWSAKWRECPEGTCRDESVNCDGPLPGTCPLDQVLCRYSSWIRGTDFECRDSSNYYVCKEDRTHNAWGNLFGKHDADWCNRYEETCEGECQPGFLKCMIDNLPTCKNCIPRCRNATEYIQCGDECKESKDYHNCNGICLSTEKLCDGNCAEGFEKCGDRCVSSTDGNIVDCKGKCQLANEICDGKCLKNGWFKAGDVCRPDKEKRNFHDCNGIFLDLEMPCNGACVGAGKWGRQLCDGKCLDWRDRQDCDGQCKPRKELCNGRCYYSNNVPCGNICILPDTSCRGECHDVNHPFKCVHPRLGETCLDAKLIGDGKEDCSDGSDEKTTCLQGWMCDGKLQCRTEPCHSTCPSHVNRTQNKGWGNKIKTYTVHYCAEDDKCKLENEPCNGVCVANLVDSWKRNVKPEDQFACHDGSKCLKIQKVCDGHNDCNDGSDEICKVKGCKNCKLEVVAKIGSHFTDKFIHCDSGDKKIQARLFCDGTKDCRDGSDEKECKTCPGIVQCNSDGEYKYNDAFVCANSPCKDRKDNTRLSCSNRGSEFLWDMCLEGPTKEPKCAKRSWRGGSFEVYNGKPVEGDLCNGECLEGGKKCGDKCLPPGMGTKWACDGSCNHHKSSRSWDPFVHCDGRCFHRDDLQNSRRKGDVLTCDGECRYFSKWPQGNRDGASRQSCNGACLAGDDGKEPWLPCATGNECFPAKEWCNGVSNCQDGSDEAKCSQCSKLVRCQHGSHPLQNQTASNGPRFPDYVCSDEPCGNCEDPGTYPCGNSCIPNDQKCPLTGRCSPSMFECDDECLDPKVVCDGKMDCRHGDDEQNCNKREDGSWFCNGIIQSKTIPCL